MSYTNPQNFIKMLTQCNFCKGVGLGHMENLDRNILIPNIWDLKGILPAGISKIGIKQHLLIQHVHDTSFVAMVTHQCKQQVESS